MRALYLLVLFPLLVLDCLGSLLVGESFNTTLSAKAHDAARKGHKHWGWTEGAINALFFWQTDRDGLRHHCAVQWRHEQQHGGLWPAYLADWRAALGLPTRTRKES